MESVTAHTFRPLSNLSSHSETLETLQSQLCHMAYSMDVVFEGVESGRRLSKRQIGFGVWKGGIAVERVEDGFLVDGERYESVSE